MPEDLLSLVLPVILVGGIGLVVGAVAGYLLAGLQTPPPPEAPKAPRGLVEVARLWRNKRSGELGLELDGEVFERVGQLSGAQRSLLNQTSEQLRLWLGLAQPAERTPSGYASAPAPVPATPRPPAPPVTPPASAYPPANKPALLDDDALLRSLLEAPSASPPVTLPASVYPPANKPALLDNDDLLLRSLVEVPSVRPASLDISGAISQAIRPDKAGKEALPETRSIAQQVDTIVQERLPSSPLAAHTIRVMDAPPGKIGLIVQVDDFEYEGVGDVRDAEIQAFLRACVAEWERRGGK